MLPRWQSALGKTRWQEPLFRGVDRTQAGFQSERRSGLLVWTRPGTRWEALSPRSLGVHFPAMRTWQLRAFRGSGICPRMPGGAWQAQVAIGDLASCERVLASAATLPRIAAGRSGIRV